MGRPKLTAVNHYNVFPFNHGGSLGIRGLYKALSEWFDINIVTFVVPKYFSSEVFISKHVKVIPIVLPDELREKQEEVYKKYNMTAETVVDSSVAAIRWYHLYPEIIERVREIAEDSEIVIAEHVYTWRVIKTACPEKHLWYRANNVEYDYKYTAWEKIGRPHDLLQEVYDIEKECVEQCEKVLTVSQLEAKRFVKLYQLSDINREKLMNIRSGYDIDNLQTVLPINRTTIDMSYEYSGLFIASNTSFTVTAACSCIAVAKECMNIKFILMGSVCNSFRGEKLPSNVYLAGVVSDDEKIYYLQHCDFALNLMEAGAGINVKMFEYFAFGIPVITTSYGARGIEYNAGKDCIITERDHYVEDIVSFCQMTINEKNEIAQNALRLLCDKYSWRSLGENIATEIQRMYNIPVYKSVLPLDEINLFTFKEHQSYLPTKPCYIRCAGDWGNRCLDFLRSKGIEPLAFVDEDIHKIGTEIQGVPVISLEEYLNRHNGTEIIVAVVSLLEFAADLMTNGVSLKEISLAWDGVKIFHVLDQTGAIPYYISARKCKQYLLRQSRYIGGLRHEES